MTRSPVRCLLVAAVVLLRSVAASPQELAASPTFAFLNVTVIDATGATPRANHTVVVSGGQIRVVASTDRVTVPPGAQTIDAAGKFLVPGLWDLHVHTRYEGIDHLRLLLVNGVTTARDMAAPWHHLAQIKLWQDEVETGERVGPTLLTAAPLLDGPDSPWSHSVIVADPQQGRLSVRRLEAEGVDFVKVYGGLSRESFFAIVDEARRVGLPFAGHVPRDVTVAEVSDAGQRSVEHMDRILEEALDRELQPRPLPEDLLLRVRARMSSFSLAKLDALAARLRGNETSVVPTLSFYQTSLGAARRDATIVEAERLQYVPAAYRTSWAAAETMRSVDAREVIFEKYVELVGLLHERGVTILAGTDVVKPFFVPGFSLHDELELLVAAGLTEMHAIQAATRDAARFVGLTDVGTVEPEMAADLVLLDADPIENIANIRSVSAVVVRGRLIAESELREMSAEIRHVAAGWVGTPTGR